MMMTMKSFAVATLCLVLAAPTGAAMADSWKDESGKGRERMAGPWKEKRGKGNERKAEYDDGRCKVEQKWGKKGDYKEKIECRGAQAPFYPYYGPDYSGYGYRYR